MSVQRTAKRYALALAHLGRDAKAQQRTLTDVIALQKLYAHSREFALFVRSPLIRPLRKAAILRSLLGQSVAPFTLNFLQLLARKNRIALLADICAAYKQQHYEAIGCVEAEVKSAYPMTEAQQGALARWVQKEVKRKPIFQLKTDSSLLGGYVLQMGELRLDMSVKGQLQYLQQTLAAAPKQ